MKKLSTILLISITVLTGCTTYSGIMSSAELSKPLTLPALTREDYQILPDVEGDGVSRGVLCFGLNCMKNAKQKAMYDAIGKLPNADMLIAPRFNISRHTFLFFYRKVTVKVKSKAIQLKTT